MHPVAAAGPAAPITRSHRNLLLAAALSTTLLIALGGIVCATESGAGCPDWPGCFGRIVPPPQVNAIIEYTHRFVAALTTPLIIAAALVSWRRARSVRWLTGPLLLAIPFTIAVIIFGAFAVLTGLPRPVAAIDLASALVVLALVLTAAVAGYACYADPVRPVRLSARAPLARLSLAALVALFGVYVSGVLIAGPASLTRCLGWPTLAIIPTDFPGWPQVARLALAALTVLLIIALVVRAARLGRAGAASPVLPCLVALIGVALVVELAAGFVILTAGAAMLLLIAYVVAATILYALLVVFTIAAHLAW